MPLNGQFLDKSGLTYLWSKLKTKFAAKQDTISDLSEIRSGAAAGATAVQQTAFETDQNRQETEIGVVANAGAKNLLNPLLACGYMSQGTQYPITVGGVTFTLNDDGSITTTGSSTATRVLRIPITVPAGSYRATGCPSGGSTSSYRIDYREAGTETFIGQVDTGNGVTLTFDEDKTFDFCLRIAAGYSQSAIFKPMIRRAEITDDTFVPHAPTNRELYETGQLCYDFIFGVGTALSSNDDLNNYKVPGKVSAASGAIAATIANTPWTQSGFTVFIIPNLTTTSCIQILLPNSMAGKWYRRRFFQNTWSLWTEYDGTQLETT